MVAGDIIIGIIFWVLVFGCCISGGKTVRNTSSVEKELRKKKDV